MAVRTCATTPSRAFTAKNAFQEKTEQTTNVVAVDGPGEKVWERQYYCGGRIRVHKEWAAQWGTVIVTAWIPPDST
jgi:hypothetical protein